MYQRRLRDDAFADRWAGAVESGYARVEMLLIERATGALEAGAGAGACAGDDGEAGSLPSDMTVAEALSLLRLGQRQAERNGRRGAAPVRVASEEEAIEALAKRLAVFGGRVLAERGLEGELENKGPSWK